MAPSSPSSSDAAKEVFEHTSSPLANVIVGRGDAQEIHYIHSSLLCAKSEYFRGCLRSGFSESASGEVLLAEQDPSAFRYFVKWIYTGDLAPFPTLKAMGVVDLMIDVYILADRVLCDGHKNRAMNMIQHACTLSNVTVENVTKAVRSGHSRSTMTSYLLRQLARDMRESAIGYEGYMATEGWGDLIMADAQATSTLMREVIQRQSADPSESLMDDPAEDEGCRWHVHLGAKSTEQCKRWKPQEFGVVDED